MEEYVKKRDKPKEWYAYESTNDHCWKVRDENGIIAKVGGNFQTDIEEANAARLIAASKEMLLALERGDSQPVFAARRSPLASRDPQKLWQAIALISILINLNS